MLRKQTTYLLLLTLLSCTHRKSNFSNTHVFKIPIIEQSITQDTFEFRTANFLEDSWPRYFGKYKFTETIKLNGNQYSIDSNYKKDLINEYDLSNNSDSLITDGFQVFPDYKTTISYHTGYSTKGIYYYPVYVVNETSSTKVFLAKDSYVFALQEARDSSEYGLWRPIEGRGFDFCGNGDFGIKVHPGEFIMFLLPKYNGIKTGLMRIRLNIGDINYVSKPFEGSFSPSQFLIDKSSWRYNRLKDDRANAIKWDFYGAIPKGYDDKELPIIN